MLFPTVEFAVFFVIVFCAYWSLSRFSAARKILLLIASYVFYGAWDWRFLFLIIGVTLVNYVAALLVSSAKTAGAKKSWLAIAIALDLGILGFFKYFLFLSTTLNNLALDLGLGAPIPVLSVILPVGISFFTFQAMSYAIDVYRGEIPADRNPLDVLLYIAFFPQLVAGPIVRAADFVPQLKRRDAGIPLETGRAFLLIAVGLFKKIVVANYLGVLLVDPVFENPAAHSGLEAVLGVYGYAFQIFCDFSAYSDIAIGVALLFGFSFPPNFDQPYRAASIQEFWRRWHISLSTWLRDYLYIPLGGNRKGTLATYRNLLLTMLLGGLWHGAAWNFVIWGAIHGAGLAVERFAGGLLRSAKKRRADAGHPERPMPSFARNALLAARTFLVFNFVCVTWVFFRSRSTEHALSFFQSIGDFSGAAPLLTPFVASLLALGAIMHFVPVAWKEKARATFSSFHPVAKAASLGAALLAITLMAPEGVAPFIYFQF